MRNNNFISLIFFVIFVLGSTASQAGTPLWTFTPLTATTISVPINSTSTVQYQVTNQSARTHTLAMNNITGVTQITSGGGKCGNPFVLSGHSSCVLSLQIDGSQVQTGSANGPIVCEQGSSLQCYRPAAADILNVNLIANQYTVGGTVSGLSGTVILLNNGGDSNTVTSNGSFTFATSLTEGSPYNVTIDIQPSDQTCTVTNGSGTLGGSNVTNVSVSCATNTTTLSTSLANLALATSGNARIITITNTGSNTAENLSINFPTWPSGTTASTSCGSSLDASDTCTITVTPGANATSSCDSPYSAPTPGVVTVSASNVTSSATTNVYVLTYGCIYEEGYLFAIDDTTSTSTSIGGIIAALTNNSSGIQWYNGSFVTTNAQSLTNGATNTATNISVQGAGSYAAETCANYTIDSSGSSPCSTGTCYSNWYLPAICQMGASGEGAGCSSGTENMVSNLSNLISACTGSACLSGDVWSSTEFSGTPQNYAWSETFSSGGNSQFTIAKSNTFGVRCARGLTP